MSQADPSTDCPGCGRVNRSGAKFCAGCGTSLAAAQVCTSCGSSNEPGSRFCDECGNPVGNGLPAGNGSTGGGSDSTAATTRAQAYGDGRYEPIGFLGEGGKKRVHLATDTKLRREVALSVFKLDGADEASIMRAHREAEAMAKLGDHPNVVTIFDIGESGDELFLVSQYMAGGDLGDHLAHAEGRGLPSDEVLRIATQIAQALEHAHARGVIHRDLKPQNVWLTPEGAAKLGDFGLAAATDHSRMTADGAMIGTVAYMPPEQGLGRTAEERSDLYSLGVVMYELICGVPPFAGGDAASVISQHVSTPPVSPSVHREDVPRALEQLVLKLLAKTPEKRPASAREAREALEAIASGVAHGDADALEGLTEGVLVGRSSEMKQLRAAVDEAVSGRGRLSFIRGEAGIGKTRLASEVETYVDLRGAEVLWGRCYEGEGAPAYWPWVQVIRAYAEGRDDAALASELGSGASDIAQVVSEIRERLPDLPAPQPLDAEQARFRLFDSITAFLRTAAESRPLAIFLEDLHLADQASLLLLQFLANDLARSRIFILGTHRDLELEEGHALPQMLESLSHERTFERIRLGPLSKPEVKALMEDVSQQPLETPDELALLDTVHGESEGNPYFIEEILRHLVESGAIYQRDGRWVSDVRDTHDLGIPQGIRNVIGGRLERLSSECAELMATAAAIGPEFRLGILERVSELPAPAVEERLGEAVDAAIVKGVQDEADRYRFSHVALRNTLYKQLSGERRVELHRAIGETLEELYENRIESHLGELAHHFAQAAPAGLAEKAADYAWWAGERAVSLSAYEEAVTQYARALRLFDTMPSEPIRRCELMLALGDARWRAGDGPAARETFKEAAVLAQQLALPDQCARAALGLVGGDAGGFSVADRADEELIDLLRTALRMLPERDSALRVRVLARLAVELYFTNDTTEPEALSREAVEMAERLGEAHVMLSAKHSRQLATLGPDTVRDDLTAGDEIVELARVVDDRETEFQGHHLKLNALLQLGDLSAVDRELKACEKLARKLRQPRYDAQVKAFRCMRAQVVGDRAEAERQAEAAFSISRRSQPEVAMVIMGAQTLFSTWGRGKVADLVEGGEAFTEQYPSSAWPSAFVFLLIEAGEHERARSLLHSIIRDGFETIRRDSNWLTAMSCLTTACEALEEAEAAETLYEMLLPYRDLWVSVLIGSGSFGCNHHYLALLAKAAGRLDDAVEHFDRAIEAHESVGGTFIDTRLRRVLARTLLERDAPGDRDRAAVEVEKGIERATRLEMPREMEQLLAIKLEGRGGPAIDVQTSIDVVATSVEQDRPDFKSVAAPDGTVTIMFSDIVDSTVLTEKLGDQRWLELLRRHNEMVRSALATHGGYEVKSQGDGFMLAFTSARKAVACAIDIQGAIADYTRANQGEPLRVRIGMHTGEALRDQEDFFGKNVILAARIAASAGAGEILVSSLLRELVASSGEFAFAGEREIVLKGLSGRQRVSAVSWAAEPSPDETQSATVPVPTALGQRAAEAIVGRRDELALLGELRSRAFEDRLGVAMIAGEPGVGKTALATRAALDAHAEGAVVLHGRCQEEVGSPYGPWAEALGPYVRAGPDAVLAAHVGCHGGEIARLVPALSERVPAASAPSLTGDPEADRSLVFMAVVDLLERAAADAPIVIQFDELHRAPESSLALLHHIVEVAPDARILVIATYRPTEVTPEEAGTEALRELCALEGVESIEMAGLSEEEVVTLMGGDSSEELDAGVRRLAAEIHRETDGNPFFVTELLRHLTETGGLVRDREGRYVISDGAAELELPPSVRELVGQRVAQLGQPAGEVLAAASVLGREFELEPLMRVAGKDREELLGLLDQAIEVSLISRAPDRQDRFRFAHALVNHTLYQQLGTERRALLHRLAAETLEELYGSDPGPRVGELAHHWMASGGADAGRALRYSVAAGRRALMDLAPDEALRWFSRALSLLERQERADHALRCDVLIGMGDAQRQTGDRRYRDTLLEACGLARELADGGRLARAALANTRGWTSTAGKVDEERVAALQDALELLGGGREPARARLVAQLALERAYDGDLPRRRALSDEALSLARGSNGSDDARTRAYVLGRRYLTIWAPETLDERVETASEFEAVAERLDDPIARFGAASWRFLASLEAGEIEAADDALDRKVALAELIGRPVMRWESLFQRGARAYLGGRLDEAEALATEAAQVGSDQPDAATIYAAQIVAIRYDQGRLHEFADLFAEAAARNQGLSTFRAALAQMYCELDRPDDARRALSSGVDSDFANVPHDNLWLTTMAAYADACAQLGEVDAAAALYPQLEPYADRIVTNGVNANGSMARLLGLLAATLERYDDADRHFAAAAAMHERIGAPIFLARTRYEWAKALLAAGRDADVERAQSMLEEAAGEAERRGCPLLKRRAEAAMIATDAAVSGSSGS